MYQRGAIVPSVLLFSVFLTVVVVALLNVLSINFTISQSERSRTSAQFAADSGVDYAMREINIDSNWSSTGGELTLLNSPDVRTTYEVSVTDVDVDNKQLVSTGRTYRPASSTIPESSQSVQVSLRVVRSGGDLSVVTGVGGLFMRNSARIINGSVYVNGEISMENSAQIGLSTNSVSVNAAHTNCPNPPDGSYPRVCADGENGEPISMLNSAHIYGEVRGTNQTDGSEMSNPGLIANQTVPPIAYPTYDRDAQIAAVATTMTGPSASCNSNGSVTWPANVRITGTVTIEKKCTVFTQGDVWIEGDLFMKQSGSMQPTEAVTERTNIMVDGALEMTQSSSFGWNGADESYQVITHRSAAGCSPDCADVTGADLFNSRNDQTIRIKNSANGEKTIFFARWTQVSLDNGGGVGAVVGQTVELKNSATITFGASAPGEGAIENWIIDGYLQTY